MGLSQALPLSKTQLKFLLNVYNVIALAALNQRWRAENHGFIAKVLIIDFSVEHRLARLGESEITSYSDI